VYSLARSEILEENSIHHRGHGGHGEVQESENSSVSSAVKKPFLPSSTHANLESLRQPCFSQLTTTTPASNG